MFGINVMDFGAKGDGITDDTAAIQSAINYTADRGGGKICFPYTKGGYRIASPAIQEYKGRALRAQLYIPPGAFNIQLEGEMPCRMMNTYQVRPLSVSAKFKPTLFGSMETNNTFLFSDWEAPEEHDPVARPWSILAAPEGDALAGNFSVRQFSITNLEFRVLLNKQKMYPTQSAVDLQNVSRVNICDSQFCLNEQVGDASLDMELQPNPCHTVGLMTSGDQNDNNVLRNVAVQGFRYGLVCGEHVVADYLYIHNCEEGITFHDSSHLSVINHIVAQHNTKIITTTREALFGHRKGPCFVKVDTLNFEDGIGLKPEVSQLQFGVYDPENRLHGSLTWHQPWGQKLFPIEGAENFKAIQY
ncbi:MAG: hypothetical protein GX783_00610 [Clostridiales bacterium]|nr:hypothetical protein [Clostridiales bacterium]